MQRHPLFPLFPHLDICQGPYLTAVSLLACPALPAGRARGPSRHSRRRAGSRAPSRASSRSSRAPAEATKIGKSGAQNSVSTCLQAPQDRASRCRRPHGQRREHALARGHGGGHRRPLRADREPIRGILDIAAAEDAPVRRQQRRADAESRVRTVSLLRGSRRLVQQFIRVQWCHWLLLRSRVLVWTNSVQMGKSSGFRFRVQGSDVRLRPGLKLPPARPRRPRARL